MLQVGRFNVELYTESNVDANGTEYHLMDLSEWKENEGKDELVKQDFLYVRNDCYCEVYNRIYSEDFLESLIQKPRNSKITKEETALNYNREPIIGCTVKALIGRLKELPEDARIGMVFTDNAGKRNSTDTVFIRPANEVHIDEGVQNLHYYIR